jgi:hypothetical protein
VEIAKCKSDSGPLGMRCRGRDAGAQPIGLLFCHEQFTETAGLFAMILTWSGFVVGGKRKQSRVEQSRAEQSRLGVW